MDARRPTIGEHALDPSLPADEAVRVLARALLADMTHALATFGAVPAAAAHETRKGIKALRALLRLADPACERLGGIDRRLRSSADLLAGAREARVLAETLRTLAPRARGAAAAPLARLARWAGERATAAEAEAFEHRRVAQVEEALNEIGESIGGWPVPGNWSALLDGARHAARRARRRLAKGLARRDADELHAARRWVVRHRYHLGFLAAAGRHTQSRRLRMQDLRDLLGRHHDLHDARRAITESGLVGITELAAIERLVTKEQRRLEKKIGRAANRLFGGRNRRLTKALKATFGQRAD